MSCRSVTLAVLTLAACADDGVTTGATTGSTSSANTTGDVTGSSSTTNETEPTSSADTSGTSGTSGTPTTGDDTSTGAGESSTGEPGFDPPVPECGNGYLEVMEECDDGNLVDGDGCNATCEVPCGLELELLELAPTAQSNISGTQVVAAPDGGFVAFGRVREITLDQEGETTIGPRQILVTAYDALGEVRWQQKVGDAMGDLSGNGGAVDDNGDVFLIGSVDGADASDIWIGKLSGIDGAEQWAKVTDGLLANGDDFGNGIAVAGDEVVAVGQIRDAMGDTDVWVRKLTADDGATVWTTSWSGTPSEGYSVDGGVLVAVAPGGEIHVLAREYVSSDVTEATLLTFGPGGGEPLWTATPLADAAKHKDSPAALAVGPDGEVILGIGRGGFAPTFWLFRLAPGGGKPTWELAAADFIDKGVDWSLAGVGIYPDGNLVVGGGWVDDVSQPDSAWVEVWTARLDPNGEKRCQVSYRAPGEDLVPPSILTYGFTAGAEGAALAIGEKIENGESSLWIGRFRPL